MLLHDNSDISICILHLFIHRCKEWYLTSISIKKHNCLEIFFIKEIYNFFVNFGKPYLLTWKSILKSHCRQVAKYINGIFSVAYMHVNVLVTVM